MKNRITKILFFIVLFLGYSVVSNAATIQIVPSTSKMTSITVSQSYTNCRNLDSAGSTLGTTSLDPHLVTNKDWAAVTYLSNSMYGTNTSGANAGIEVEFSYNGTTYTMKSTNGNATGVMNWGTTLTQTAGLTKELIDLVKDKTADEKKAIMSNYKYNDDWLGSTTYTNVSVLLENIGSRYVEEMNAGSYFGTATKETSGWYSAPSYWGQNTNVTGNTSYVFPLCIRSGLFGFFVGNGGRLRAVRPAVLHLDQLFGTCNFNSRAEQ